MVRLEAPARISMPRRVRVTTYQRRSAVDQTDHDDRRAVHRVARAAEEIDVPLQPDGSEANSAARPQMMATSSLKNRIRPKVASTWSRWSRW